jgi:ABC-type nitrate/sulfonate/bicarbonate transport system substrate-binding protein
MVEDTIGTRSPLDHAARAAIDRRRFLGQAAAVGLAPALLGRQATAAAPTAPRSSLLLRAPAQQQRYKARINQAFQALLYLTLYIANDVGFFDEEGVDVEITTAGGGTQSWSAVLGGSADYSIHDPIFPSISDEKGQKDGIVVGTICNGEAIMTAAKDPAIAQTTDPKVFMTQTIKGKTIATQPEPDSQWVLLRYLGAQYGVEMGKDFQNQQVTIGTEMAPVLAGKADLGTSFPPAADIALSQGLHEVFDFSNFFGPFALSGLCTTKTYISKNPDAHQAVANAFEKASQYAYAFPDEAIKIAQQEFPDEDPKVIASSARRTLSRYFVPQHLYVDGEAWAESQKLNLFGKNIAQEHPITEAVDNTAALNAYRKLGFLRLTEWNDKPRPITGKVVR